MVNIHNGIFFPLIMLSHISNIIGENKEVRIFNLLLHVVQCRFVIFLCADIAKHCRILRLKVIPPANMHTHCTTASDSLKNLLISHSLLCIRNLRKPNQLT